MDNLFEQAATLAKVQAEGYRQVRERARDEALEEAAKRCDDFAAKMEEYPSLKSERGAVIEAADLIRRLKARA